MTIVSAGQYRPILVFVQAEKIPSTYGHIVHRQVMENTSSIHVFTNMIIVSG